MQRVHTSRVEAGIIREASISFLAARFEPILRITTREEDGFKGLIRIVIATWRRDHHLSVRSAIPLCKEKEEECLDHDDGSCEVKDKWEWKL